MTDRYIDAVLDGRALWTDVDDYVARWHENTSGEELHEYLGLTWDEYALWIEKPETLRLIVAAHELERRGPVRQPCTARQVEAELAGEVEPGPPWTDCNGWPLDDTLLPSVDESYEDTTMATTTSSYHDRRLARRLEDPEFREAFERSLSEIQTIDAITNALDHLREEHGINR